MHACLTGFFAEGESPVQDRYPWPFPEGRVVVRIFNLLECLFGKAGKGFGILGVFDCNNRYPGACVIEESEVRPIVSRFIV